MSISATAAARLRKAARVILVGPPGCGKGTQTTRVLNRYPQLTALSSGDLLRQNVRAGTPIGITFQKQHFKNSTSQTLSLRIVMMVEVHVANFSALM